ncbi:MAG: DUF507 family protein [Thermodesulfovibrionales bacterium]|nr:DUF507 family protein [Thermodesulfovibrionales bacterium]
MMLSDEKVRHLTHQLYKSLVEKQIITPIENEEKIRKEIKRTIREELRLGEDIDEAVRKKIESLSKKPVEGSQEWDILYRKYFAEEESRRGRR